VIDWTRRTLRAPAGRTREVERGARFLAIRAAFLSVRRDDCGATGGSAAFGVAP